MKIKDPHDYLDNCIKKYITIYNEEVNGMSGFKAVSQIHRELLASKEAIQSSLEHGKEGVIEYIINSYARALTHPNSDKKESFETRRSYVIEHINVENLKYFIDKYFKYGFIESNSRGKILKQLRDEIECSFKKLEITGSGETLDLELDSVFSVVFKMREKDRQRLRKILIYSMAYNHILSGIIDSDFCPVLDYDEIKTELKKIYGAAKANQENFNARYEKYKDQYIKAVRETMGNKTLDACTKTGLLNKFCDNVHKKIKATKEELPFSTFKKWVIDDLESGKLQRLIDNVSENEG